MHALHMVCVASPLTGLQSCLQSELPQTPGMAQEAAHVGVLSGTLDTEGKLILNNMKCVITGLDKSEVIRQ